MGDNSLPPAYSEINGHTTEPLEDIDVLIIGAGISGINAAQRIKTKAPAGTSFAVLESRDDLGGTWSFFKYPGLRSDSDLHTFGFPWRPWRANEAIATGPAILSYMRECVQSAGLDESIRYKHKVVAADWRSAECRWRVRVLVNGTQEKTMIARYMIFGTGYYDYENPMKTTIPGIERFEGTTVHPQFWPEDLDWTDKKVAIIGSGATAITVFPEMAKTAEHVTIVQRSPSYILSMPNKDPVGAWYRKWLPGWMSSRIDKMRYMCVAYLFFYFCRAWPNTAKKILEGATRKQLRGSNVEFDPHFIPAYNPWEQRLCLCPDGDFYRAIRKGKGDIITGPIRTVTEKGIDMESGETRNFDIIVTATGLKIHLAGGMNLTLDGQGFKIADKFMWKGVMLQDLPNAAFVIGYTNASWTLGAEATALMIIRLLFEMKKRGKDAIVPRLEDAEGMGTAPMLNLNSTYIKNASHYMPKSGTTGQWAPRGNFFVDTAVAKWGNVVKDLEFLAPTEGKKTI